MSGVISCFRDQRIIPDFSSQGALIAGESPQIDRMFLSAQRWWPNSRPRRSDPLVVYPALPNNRKSSVLFEFGIKDLREMDRRLRKKVFSTPSMWGAAAKYCLARLFRRPRVILQRNGVRLEVGTGPGQGAWCGVAGDDYEPELIPWLKQLRPGQTVIDIGANIGVFSLRASRIVGPKGRVISFEPISQSCAVLRKNAELNHCKNMVIIEKALGDTAGTIKIRTSGHLSSASIMNSDFVHETEVGLTTLDQEIKRLGLCSVDTIKMDIEGAEPLAIRGMGSVISTYHPMILFENGPAGEATCQLLESLGYEIGNYDCDQRWSSNRNGGNLFARFKR